MNISVLDIDIAKNIFQLHVPRLIFIRQFVKSTID